MEAHRPMIPPRRFRERMMTPEQVDRSYLVDRSWNPMWAYGFGLYEYTQADLDVMAATYDATIAELDDLFHSLIASLEASGHLEDTVVILTADHGEHIGDHHMMDHQYSLYEGLTHVPLVIYAPGRVQAGRRKSAVSNYDLFPTLLELADVPPPPDLVSSAHSLLAPAGQRALLAELPSTFTEPFGVISRAYPGFDPSVWDRTLVSYREGPSKLIWSSRGDHELYDLSSDPGEAHNLFDAGSEDSHRLLRHMQTFVRQMQEPPAGEGPASGPSAEHLQRLKSLGYIAGDDPQEKQERD